MLIFGMVLLIFLIGIYPFWDKKYTKRLEETLPEKDRIAYFKYVIYSEWAVTFIILINFYPSARWIHHSMIVVSIFNIVLVKSADILDVTFVSVEEYKLGVMSWIEKLL